MRLRSTEPGTFQSILGEADRNAQMCFWAAMATLPRRASLILDRSPFWSSGVAPGQVSMPQQGEVIERVLARRSMQRDAALRVAWNETRSPSESGIHESSSAQQDMAAVARAGKDKGWQVGNRPSTATAASGAGTDGSLEGLDELLALDRA